jgi:aspartyl-tRNA(Asn)/glutamyl-tRNA(Gln) amidotransferase subunit C
MIHDPLSQAEIHRVAATLARLALTGAEERQTAADFESILSHVDTLETADTAAVGPTHHAGPVGAGWREDVVRPSLPVDEALRMAPERLGDGFGVPKIIE